MKLNKNDETVRIHFLSDVMVCRHLNILLPWQCEVMTSALYSFVLLPTGLVGNNIKKKLVYEVTIEMRGGGAL